MLSVHVDPTRLLNSSFPSPLWPCLLSVRLFDWLAWIPCYSEVPYTKWLGSRSSIQLRQVRVAPCCWIPVFPGFFCWLMFLLKVVVITWMCLQHSLRPSLSPNRFPTPQEDVWAKDLNAYARTPATQEVCSSGVSTTFFLVPMSGSNHSQNNNVK